MLLESGAIIIGLNSWKCVNYNACEQLLVMSRSTRSKRTVNGSLTTTADESSSSSSLPPTVESNDFPVLSQEFSQIGSQDYVPGSPERTLSVPNSQDSNEDGVGVGTATTTPRSEFQAFANSILTPLMLHGEDLNINTGTDTVNMETTVMNTASVDVSPLIPSYQLLDQHNQAQTYDSQAINSQQHSHFQGLAFHRAGRSAFPWRRGKWGPLCIYVCKSKS